MGHLEPAEKLRGELSKTRANEAPWECVETVLVVQGDEEKVILGVEDKLGHSSADLGRVLDPDAKLHRRESRANALFTNLGKGDAPNEAIRFRGGEGRRSSWGQRRITYGARLVSAAARRASGCRKWPAAGWLGRRSPHYEERWPTRGAGSSSDGGEILQNGHLVPCGDGEGSGLSD